MFVLEKRERARKRNFDFRVLSRVSRARIDFPSFVEAVAKGDRVVGRRKAEVSGQKSGGSRRARSSLWLLASGF
jgi:hypothetical protein